MIIFPMAGLSSRFTKAGFNKPKYMLRVGGRSTFAHAVAGFTDRFQSEPLIFVCRDIAGTPAFIEAELEKMMPSPPRYQVIVLDEATSGQAETVALGLAKADQNMSDPLTVFNIDTFRPGFSYPAELDLSRIDGYLEVFRGEGEHWSFVRPRNDVEQSGVALEVAEKQRLSDLCCTGLYYFRTAQTFLDLYDQTLGTDPTDLQGGERYVAPLYNMAIQAGHDIRYHIIDRDDVIFCGTPDEYYDIQEKMMPETALCISGQIRSPKAHLKHLARLAEHHGADVFISTWAERGRKTLTGATGLNQLHRLFGEEAALAFPRTFVNQMFVLFPDVQEHMSAHAVQVEPELRDVFAGAEIDIEEPNLHLSFENKVVDHNSQRMLYLVWRCNQLKRKAEATRQRRYKNVIRMRSDILPNIQEFLNRKNDNTQVYFPFNGDTPEPRMNDIYWMSTSEQDDALCGLFGKSIAEPQRPWSNIHYELYDHVKELGFDWIAAKPIKWFQEDISRAEQDENTAKVAEVLARPDPISPHAHLSTSDQAILARALLAISSGPDEGLLTTLLADVSSAGALNVLRAVLIAVLANTRSASIAARQKVLAVIFATVVCERKLKNMSQIDRLFLHTYTPETTPPNSSVPLVEAVALDTFLDEVSDIGTRTLGQLEDTKVAQNSLNQAAEFIHQCSNLVNVAN